MCELLGGCIKLNKVCLDGIANLQSLKFEELCEALKKFFVTERKGTLEVTFSKYYFKFHNELNEQDALEQIKKISKQLYFRLTYD